MPFVDHFIAIGELLLLANNNTSNGTVDDIDKFRELLEMVRKYNKDQRNLEDVQNKRLVFGKTKSGLKPIHIKYYKAFAEFQNEIGLVNNKELIETDKMFPYDHIVSSSVPKIDFENMSDWKETLDPFWPLSLQLRYGLQEHYRTKKQYNYIPDLLDFTVLFGWFLSTCGREELSIILSDKQENEIAQMQKHFEALTEKSYSADDFFKTYVDNSELVPITVRTPEGIIMDSHTLLFFIIYLQGCPDPKIPAVKNRGQIIEEMRGEVAEKFEGWVRDTIYSKGYNGPETAIIEKYEYDIIAISEKTKTILLADAKYRDMAPSSFTGDNLIAQELLGKHALRFEADRQQQRLEYFMNNKENFDKYLHPKNNWDEYSVDSYLVTKQIPLANRYREVKIKRAIDFINGII